MNSASVCEATSPADWRGKLLADLLQSVHLRSSVYFRPELGAPWAFSIANYGSAFHIVEKGKCSVEFRGERAVDLVSGDFVIIPRGHPHVMRDSDRNQIVDFFELAKRSAPDAKRAFRAGGNGAITKLLCGGMQFDNSATDPLLAVLPRLILVKGANGKAATGLQATVSQILEELDSYHAGALAVITRLADILFIKAVRAYFEQNLDRAEFGWMAAIRDPQVGPALALLHGQPQENWTVAVLARRVGLSRSLFAAKFAELVGKPPLHYLKRLRLNAAATRLRSTNDKLSAIAAGAGYESAAAFTKAFKRNLGKTPGEYRRALSAYGS